MLPFGAQFGQFVPYLAKMLGFRGAKPALWLRTAKNGGKGDRQPNTSDSLPEMIRSMNWIRCSARELVCGDYYGEDRDGNVRELFAA